MWWMFFILPVAFAQETISLKAVQELSEKLPSAGGRTEFNQDQKRNFRPLNKVIVMEEITSSGTEEGSILKGQLLIRLEDDKGYKTPKQIYVKFFKKEDEFGYKYLVNKNGLCEYKIDGDKVESIKLETALYEPPLRYTPAPQIIRAEYDLKLNIRPQALFLTGISQGQFMADLFNDSEARSGKTNQFAAAIFTDWKLPVLVGFVVNYEKSSYQLTDGDVNFTNFSFGPQFRTKDFNFIIPLRFQAQFRVSPLARAVATGSAGETTYKFNSADLMASLETPFKNEWGEFTLGVFTQTQWLNLKDQPPNVSINASNSPNQLLGLTLSQVFQ